MKIFRLAYLRGEWWIIDGSAQFADGDVGDFNHEAYAIQYAQSSLMDGEGDWDEWKTLKAINLFQEIRNNYDEDVQVDMRLEAQNDPEAFLLNHMKESGIDEETFFVANGNHRDPRSWSIQKLGWKRMKGNDIETWTLTQSDLRDIYNGIIDIDSSGEEDLENETFNIEVQSNGGMYWGVPFDVIESGNLNELMKYRSRSDFGVVAKRHANMKIYRLAQTSSLMYYMDSQPYGITLTSDPSRAEAFNTNKMHFPVYILRPGKYYNPHEFYMGLSDAQIRSLKKKGFLGVVSGEDMIVFDQVSLRPVGEYDVNQHRIVK